MKNRVFQILILSLLAVSIAKGQIYAPEINITTDANGKVGIGISTPAYDLDVNGDIRFKYGRSIFSGTGTYQTVLTTGWDGAGQDFLSFHVPGNTGDGLAKLYIKSDGSIGIGTTSPSSTLHLMSKAISGAETPFKIQVSDAPNDYFSIGNTTTGTSQFIPIIKSYRESDNRGVLFLMAEIPSSLDNGTISVMNFDSRVTGGAIQNRPLFSWNAYGQSKMIMTSNGNVGIGTENPSELFHVNGSMRAGNLYIGNWSGNAGYAVFVHNSIKDVSNSYALLQHPSGVTYLNAAAGQNIYFRINNQTYMTMNSQGKVSIGPPSSGVSFAVSGTMSVGVANGNNNNSPGIIAAPNDDFLYDGQYINHYGLGFHNYQDPSSTLNGVNAYMSGYFGVDIFTGGQERLRVNRNGTVSIGTISTSYKLDVNGTLRATSVTESSDRRLKEDISPLTTYDLRLITGHQYNLKKDGSFHFGVIAQEVEKIYPHMVSTDEQGMKSVAYNEFIPLLIEKSKEQDKVIQTQQNKIENLEKRIEELEKILIQSKSN